MNSTEESNEVQNSSPSRKTISISYSSLGSFGSCPMRFVLSKCSNFEVPRRSSAASLIGTAIHEAFQFYLITRSFDGAIKVLMLKYPIKLKKAMQGNYHFLTAYRILRELVNWFEQGTYDLLYINEKPAIEFKVDTTYLIEHTDKLRGNREVELDEVNYIGFIDAIFIDRSTGEIVVCDIKTSSTTSSEEEEISKYALSPQTVEYVTNILNLLGFDQQEAASLISSIKVLYLICRFKGTEYAINPLFLSKTPECVDNLMNGLRQVVRLIESNGLSTANYYKSGNCVTYGNRCPFFEWCQSGAVCQLTLQQAEDPRRAYSTKKIIKVLEV
nr:MAG TPA: PD-(D/E)XK nuclease superfamily protein [Caudoviricetes sp.]